MKVYGVNSRKFQTIPALNNWPSRIEYGNYIEQHIWIGYQLCEGDFIYFIMISINLFQHVAILTPELSCNECVHSGWNSVQILYFDQSE